jgi:hypothetical protein
MPRIRALPRRSAAATTAERGQLPCGELGRPRRGHRHRGRRALHCAHGRSDHRRPARRNPALAARGTLAGASAEAAIQRVLERVAQGGDFVPEGIVRRRFQAGKTNFEAVYKPLVDAWALYDNSDSEPVLLDWGDKR